MFLKQDGGPFERGRQFELGEMAKNGKANEEPTPGTGVIRLIQVSEWKALPIWTRNTLRALITDKDKQMSGYHSQHACFHPVWMEEPINL